MRYEYVREREREREAKKVYMTEANESDVKSATTTSTWKCISAT